MFVNLMLALHRQPRRHEGRGTILPLFALLFSATFFLSLPASLAEQGSQKKPSTLTTRLMNLEATAKETFRYNASLYNGDTRSKIYALSASIPPGWNISFRIDGMQVTSFRLDSSRTQDISIEITPSPEVKPGKYAIPVTALTDGDSLRLDLEAVVKGSYTVELTTPTGLLSDEVTEGSRKPIHFTVKNTGSLPLDALELSAQSPSKWDATFEPSKIERIEPGKSYDVVATIHVPDKTIAGDYLSNFSVKNNHANANASFRITVTTSWLAGWLGMLIILVAVGIVYYLVRKYGRR
jgi:uncharacterized membrane protein